MTQKKEDALKAGMNNLELGSTQNYIDSLPAPEPCTPIRSGGGNFKYFNSIQGNNDVYNFFIVVAMIGQSVIQLRSCDQNVPFSFHAYENPTVLHAIQS